MSNLTDYFQSAVRLSAVEAWRNAADRAEEFASLYEEVGAEISGSEALRRLADAFRLIAGDLDTLPSPSTLVELPLSSPASPSAGYPPSGRGHD